MPARERNDVRHSSGGIVPEPILTIAGVSKTYRNGPTALGTVDLTVNRGEIFALLGPNGAGKTTLISIICGIVTPSSGTVTVAGHDVVRDYKQARRAIGLVPQELATDQFETVLATVTFSPGCSDDPAIRIISNRCCATCHCGKSVTRGSRICPAA